MALGQDTRGSRSKLRCLVAVPRFHRVAFYPLLQRRSRDLLNDPSRQKDDPFEPFVSFFFSRGRAQWWTEDGPDGRRGRCAAPIASNRGDDPATSHHPATVDDLVRGGTSAWRIAPAACATVSHEILSHLSRLSSICPIPLVHAKEALFARACARAREKEREYVLHRTIEACRTPFFSRRIGRVVDGYRKVEVSFFVDWDERDIANVR